jgi:hypothetical protein
MECGSGGGSPCGFEFAAQLAPPVFSTLRQAGVIKLEAVLANGDVAHTELSLSGVRVLGELSGREWNDLTREVTGAAALGAADRKLAQEGLATAR